MTDEFKQSPIDQVRDTILQSQAQEKRKWEMEQAEKAAFDRAYPHSPKLGSGHYVITAVMHESDGRRVELIDKSEYYRALDQKQRAEELLEVAHDEIRKLHTIINYLEARNGQGTTETEGAVQMGSGPSLPSQER